MGDCHHIWVPMTHYLEECARCGARQSPGMRYVHQWSGEIVEAADRLVRETVWEPLPPPPPDGQPRQMFWCGEPVTPEEFLRRSAELCARRAREQYHYPYHEPIPEEAAWSLIAREKGERLDWPPTEEGA